MQYIDLISTFGGKTGWERVQSEYKGEITNASQTLGRENVLVLLLKDQMTRGYTGFGRWHEAEQLHLEYWKRERGPWEPRTFNRSVVWVFWLKFIKTSHGPRKLKEYKCRYRKR